MTAAEWNQTYQIGQPVRYWPFEREGDGILSKTRSEAWELGSGHPVVKVDGKAGGIILSHIEPAVMPTEYESAPICPYCGFDDSDDRYDGEGEHEYNCARCGRDYICQVHVSIKYSTRPMAVPA